MRAAFGPGPKLVVPGVRSKGRGDDQKRTLDPLEAVAAGADRLVIGRPITASGKPVRAAQRVLDELESPRTG